ncbi:hypothetical protein F7725_021759 [Dissostichus mawsoni]|uniref:Uncharacterized protein n=1 Tax=Dissostichus mawsoni TaxID=36200 RepID=A0A7J5ZCS6_DISMA|nr:hypothetical protein F7725_021759 [Dissostichus mawsoni]
MTASVCTIRVLSLCRNIELVLDPHPPEESAQSDVAVRGGAQLLQQQKKVFEGYLACVGEEQSMIGGGGVEGGGCGGGVRDPQEAQSVGVWTGGRTRRRGELHSGRETDEH